MSTDDRERALCEHCGAPFEVDAVPTTRIPSAVLFRCPACERWTE